MGTTIRPELSEKNPYWIERHRYYELKHFCLQYPIWKKAYAALDGLSRRPSDLEVFSKKGEISDPTVRCVEARSYYIERMKTVEQVAIVTDAELSSYILKGVTEGWSYDILKARLNIPCCKDVYYNLYRRFFWLLKPYVISPEEFGEFEEYEKISLTYYADQVLTDENNEEVDDVEEIVGEESLTHFGEYEDDSVFVRNDRLKCDYEILLDQRNYSDVTKTMPHRVEER